LLVTTSRDTKENHDIQHYHLNATTRMKKDMSEPDLLSIDIAIRKQFMVEYNNLPLYIKQLKDMDATIKSSNLTTRLRRSITVEHARLKSYINEIETQTKYNFYLANSASLVEEYKKILKIPIKMNFMGRAVKKSKRKRTLIKSYLAVAAKYINIVDTKKQKQPPVVCLNCGNRKDFDILDKTTYTCMSCFAEQNIMKHNSSYNDINRVNISSKYMYDRKVHFRDCIKQYQGKQNCTIIPKVYKDLEKEFFLHHLLEGDKSTSNTIRFQNITKNHILMFLKELGYSNHYENVHLIHCTLTCIKPDDISHLEDQLLEDFDALTELYDRMYKHIDRKNFINTQYVLYQLLRRHKHPCKKEEFIILKTIDRKFFHDEVCQNLFTELGWNHTPFY